MGRGRKMSNDSQFEKDVEFVSGQFLCADLPKDWNKEGELDNEVFYTWLEQNAWSPYEHWTGEKIYSAIVDLAVDMRAYINLEKREEESIF
tara:strand:+ start:627 stop:899 length:273 start_codon:yes stop_codon:yes gene_type:complete